MNGLRSLLFSRICSGSHLGACISGFHGCVHLGCRSTRKVGRTCALVFCRQFPPTPDNRKSSETRAVEIDHTEREIFFEPGA